MTDNQKRRIALSAMPGKADIHGNAHVGFSFVDGRSMNRGPEGTRWSKLASVGISNESLQLDDFCCGSQVRFTLDPSGHKPNAIGVWNETTENFVGLLPKSCHLEVATWLREGGAGGLITSEFFTNYERSNIGILAWPLDAFEVVIEGLPPESATKRMATLKRERDALLRTAPKYGGMLIKAADKGLTRASAIRLRDLHEEFESECFDIVNEPFQPEVLLSMLEGFGLATEGGSLTQELMAGLNEAATDLSSYLESIAEDWSDLDSDERESLIEDAELAIDDLMSKLLPRGDSLETVVVAIEPAPAQLYQANGEVLGVTDVSSSQDPSPPPAAWYDDPSTPGQYRYWDGAVWTPHTAPK